MAEKLYSPEFTATEEGCTWIKETAWAPGEDKTVIAEGYFGAANERTMWHQPPTTPPGGELPRTGADIGVWAALAGGLVLVGTALAGLASRRRRRGERA